MITFGFWNVDLRHNIESDERELPRLAAELAFERSLDVLFLIECAIPYDSLLKVFREGPEYYPINCSERFKILTRFDPAFMHKVMPPLPNDRFDIWNLTLPLQKSVIISNVHGLDKRNNSVLMNGLFFQRVANDISYCEEIIGHSRSVVLGDFN